MWGFFMFFNILYHFLLTFKSKALYCSKKGRQVDDETTLLNRQTT